MPQPDLPAPLVTSPAPPLRPGAAVVERRRARLLTQVSYTLAASALAFAAVSVGLRGSLNPTALTLLVGGGAALGFPWLLRRTGSTVLPGTLLSLEFVLLTGAIVFVGNGFEGAALLWAPAVPLLASFLVGPRTGLAMTVLVVAELAFIFGLDRAGFAFPDAYDPASEDVLRLLGLGGLAVILMLFGWLYESQTIEKLRRMHAELKRAHATLRRREARFSWLVRHNADLMTILAPDGTVRYQSPSSSATLGYRSEDVVGTKGFALVHPDDLDRARACMGEVLSGKRKAVPSSYRMRAADGRWRWLEAVVTDGRNVPGVEGLVVNARDVTERVRHEEELRAAKERAEEMVRLKDAFLANMSHEIRTPLTSVLGFAEVLAEEVPADLREPVALIQRGGRRLMDTLNSVLDLARLEAGALDLRPTLLDLGAEVQDAVAMFRPQAEKRGLRLSVHVPEAPIEAVLDRPSVARILNNLIGNAVKFTERGEVRVSLAARGGSVVLQVADTGVGMCEAFQAHLFTAFKQESEGHGRTHEGSGLGLAISRQLVERAGGTIAVRSRKGVGTTFAVTLPATPALAQAA